MEVGVVTFVAPTVLQTFNIFYLLCSPFRHQAEQCFEHNPVKPDAAYLSAAAATAAAAEKKSNVLLSKVAGLITSVGCACLRSTH